MLLPTSWTPPLRQVGNDFISIPVRVAVVPTTIATHSLLVLAVVSTTIAYLTLLCWQSLRRQLPFSVAPATINSFPSTSEQASLGMRMRMCVCVLRVRAARLTGCALRFWVVDFSSGGSGSHCRCSGLYGHHTTTPQHPLHPPPLHLPRARKPAYSKQGFAFYG